MLITVGNLVKAIRSSGKKISPQRIKRDTAMGLIIPAAIKVDRSIYVSDRIVVSCNEAKEYFQLEHNTPGMMFQELATSIAAKWHNWSVNPLFTEEEAELYKQYYLHCKRN